MKFKWLILLLHCTSFASLAQEINEQSSNNVDKKPAPEAANNARLPEISVTATRTTESIGTLSNSVTVVTREQIENQQAVSHDLGELLGKSVPGLAAGSQSLSNVGQTLRGRNVMVLIDGVPQSAIRNVGRDFSTIDPAVIERIEVIRGATAIYGDGATGGIVNIITKKPTAGEPLFKTEAGFNFSASHPKDSLGTHIGQTISGVSNPFDYILSGAFTSNSGYFDAEGDRIPPELLSTQGGLSDLTTYDLFAKSGIKISDRQRLQLTVNGFQTSQDTKYATDPSVNNLPAGSKKASTREGLELAEQSEAKNTFINLDYNHQQLLSSKLHAQLYHRDFVTRFFPFDGRAFSTYRNIVQSRLETTRTGGRLELETPVFNDIQVLWGLDASSENTSQPVAIMDATAYDQSGGLAFNQVSESSWVPPMETSNLGLFSQFEWTTADDAVLRFGLRRERNEVSIDNYTTLVGNSIQGGNIDFADTLYNAGIVWYATNKTNLFVNFSQGYSLPDIGLILRNAPAGSSVDTLNTEPQKVDMYEVGVRNEGSRIQTSLSTYFNESELGTSSGGLNRPIVRAPERVWGWEASIDAKANKDWSIGGTASWVEGENDADNDGAYTDLNTFRISPFKTTAYLEHKTLTGAAWQNRLQLLYVGSRDPGLDESAYGGRSVKSYVLVDWISTLKIASGQLRFGIENLLNNQYYPTTSQLLSTGRNDSYVAGRGTVISIAYALKY